MGESWSAYKGATEETPTYVHPCSPNSGGMTTPVNFQCMKITHHNGSRHGKVMFVSPHHAFYCN